MKLPTGDADYPSRIFQSPFPQENLCLLINDKISTKYLQRADSYTAIAPAIEAVVNTHVGNYLVYFPSYLYMNAVVDRPRDRLPERPLLVQERGMTEEARDVVLIDERFTHTHYRNLFSWHWRGYQVLKNTDEMRDKLAQFWLRK